MKIPRYLTLFLVSLFLLAGCAKQNNITLSAKCDPDQFANTPCGICIVSECKKLCDACTFNEPACQACWKCIADKSCGADGPSDDFSGYKSKDNKHHFYGKAMTVTVPTTEGNHISR